MPPGTSRDVVVGDEVEEDVVADGLDAPVASTIFFVLMTLPSSCRSFFAVRASQEFLEKKLPRHGVDGIGLVALRPRLPVATLVKPSSSTMKKPFRLS